MSRVVLTNYSSLCSTASPPPGIPPAPWRRRGAREIPSASPSPSHLPRDRLPCSVHTALGSCPDRFQDEDHEEENPGNPVDLLQVHHVERHEPRGDSGDGRNDQPRTQLLTDQGTDFRFGSLGCSSVFFGGYCNIIVSGIPIERSIVICHGLMFLS